MGEAGVSVGGIAVALGVGWGVSVGSGVAVDRASVSVGGVGVGSPDAQLARNRMDKHIDVAITTRRFDIIKQTSLLMRGSLIQFVSNPVIDHIFQNADGYDAVAQYGIVEFLDVKRIPQLFHSALAHF